MMNYNLSRKVSGKSSLGDIQNSITSMFFEKQDLTQEEISTFAANLYTNPNMFDKNVDYSSVKSVPAHFHKCLSDYKQLSNSNSMTM